ncbi:hypothetical protein TthSNM11_06610 [Thermus thermophilus]|nr:hypothetical protein TthSNM11_06610 [Thermus thermophilus]
MEGRFIPSLGGGHGLGFQRLQEGGRLLQYRGVAFHLGRRIAYLPFTRNTLASPHETLSYKGFFSWNGFTG